MEFALITVVGGMWGLILDIDQCVTFFEGEDSRFLLGAARCVGMTRLGGWGVGGRTSVRRLDTSALLRFGGTGEAPVATWSVANLGFAFAGQVKAAVPT